MCGRDLLLAVARIVAVPHQGQSIGKRVILVSGLSFLAACSGGEPIHTASTNRSVPLENAFVLPPPGGPTIVGIIERRFTNATQQDIALATNSQAAGQNNLRVRLFGPVERAGAGLSSLSIQSMTPVNVIAEMRAALPGVAMARSPYYVQNRYGPFGYAVGRKGGSDLCLYGWQNLRGSPAVGNNKGQIDIRLRLCQSGATEQQLLSVMYGYTVAAFFSDRGWNPYGDAPPLPEGLGKPGNEIYPLSETRYETVITQPPAATPVARARQPQAVVAPPVQPEPTGPRVPPPPALSESGGAPPVVSPRASQVVVPSPPVMPREPGVIVPAPPRAIDR